MHSQYLFRERLSLVPEIPSTQSLGRPEHQWGCPNSGLALKASPRSRCNLAHSPSNAPTSSYRIASGHGPQDRPSTTACWVPELVEQVSWGEEQRPKEGPRARVCWPQPRQPSNSPWGQGVPSPSVGGQDWDGEGHPRKPGVISGKLPISDNFPPFLVAPTCLKGQKLI